MLKELKPSRNQLYFSVICIFVALIICSAGCQQKNTNRDDLTDGKALSQKYCISCHQWPDPALIDSASWVRGVLPAMALRLGVKSYMGQYFIDQGSSLSISDWQKIVNYYAQISPKQLVIPKPKVAAKSDWAIFSLLNPRQEDKAPIAMTTLLAYNPYDGHFYSGDAGNNFYRWDEQLHPTLVRKMTSPVTGAIFSKDSGKNEAVVTCIGFLPPRDVVKGQVVKLELDSKAVNKDQQVLGDSLPRAVQTVAADFNKDGLTDYVVCGFGHEFGGLYLLQQRPDHSFTKKALRNVPGGEQLITGDFN
ncbi:MAG: VCBS repeat-containing protein, partial [Bacteroidetes bacterium]|nr:VCBS repeat-containing protein [Bacteroidota bacterium]